MINRNHDNRRFRPWSLTAALAIGSAMAVTGCGKPPPPPPPPPPPKKAPPPPPKPVEVAPLMAELKPDARVQFPQEQAPVDLSLAKAAIRLADALAKGDSGKLSGLLDESSKSILDTLVASGGWDEGTKKIEAVRVTSVMEAGDGAGVVTTAIQEPGAAYVLCWTGMKVGESTLFMATPAVKDVLRRAEDWDGKPAVFAGLVPAHFQPPTPDDAPGTPAPTEAPAEEKKEGESGFKRKNTPGGPVNVPTGTPGGG